MQWFVQLCIAFEKFPQDEWLCKDSMLYYPESLAGNRQGAIGMTSDHRGKEIVRDCDQSTTNQSPQYSSRVTVVNARY